MNPLIICKICAKGDLNMNIIGVVISIIIFLSMMTWIGLSIYQKILEIKQKPTKKQQKGGDK